MRWTSLANRRLSLTILTSSGKWYEYHSLRSHDSKASEQTSKEEEGVSGLSKVRSLCFTIGKEDSIIDAGKRKPVSATTNRMRMLNVLMSLSSWSSRQIDCAMINTTNTFQYVNLLG
jgi:hypothetical protein